jgi:Domain of unknown function (DUF6265)
MKRTDAHLIKVIFVLVLVLIGAQVPLFGQSKYSNTIFYHDSIGSPDADLSAISWIAGHWRGQAFGGITEEIWTPPLGGSMMCAFKLIMDDKVNFYELETITEENHTLILKLKHFHSNLIGWEEKDKSVDFKLVKVTPNRVYFDGLTFEQVSKNELNVYVVIAEGEEKSEVTFNYKRVK